MRTPELIATHTNTDFDAFAAMVAAHKLYPEAQISLGGAVNRNVREFQALYADAIPVVDPADVDRDSVRRLILVDTVHANRLGDLGDLCGREGVQVVAFDHHAHPDDLPEYLDPDALVSSDDGSLVTLLVRIIAERGHPGDAVRGDGVRAGHPRGHRVAHVRDDDHTRRRGARLLHARRRGHGAARALADQRAHAGAAGHAGRRAADRARSCPSSQASVLLSALHEDLYVEGVSVVAHRVMDLTGCDAYFLLVEMEGRVFVTARSRGGRVDVAEALRAVGGGGHTAAASAVVKDRSLDEVAAAVAAAAPAAVAPTRVALDALEPGPPTIADTTPVDEAALLCRRDGLGGLGVLRGGLLVGRVALADLERASAHGLGHAPVKAVMTTRVPLVWAQTPLERVALRLAQDEVGWLPVVADEPGDSGDEGVALGQPARRRLATVGVRRAAARARRAGDRRTSPGRWESSAWTSSSGTSRPWPPACAAATSSAAPCATCSSREPGFDVDLAVEGDGIAFATELAARLKGHVRPHQKFGTAVVVVARRRGAAARRRRVHARRVLRVPGRPAQGRARGHPQRPRAPRLLHQRHGGVAQARDLRRPLRLLRRP